MVFGRNREIVRDSLRQQYAYEDGKLLFRLNGISPPVIVTEEEMENAVEAHASILSETTWIVVPFAVTVALFAIFLFPNEYVVVPILLVCLLLALAGAYFWVQHRTAQEVYSEFKRRPAVGHGRTRWAHSKAVITERSWRNTLSLTVATLAFLFFKIGDKYPPADAGDWVWMVFGGIMVLVFTSVIVAKLIWSLSLGSRPD